MNRYLLKSLLFLSTLTACVNLEAVYVQHQGKWVKERLIPTATLQEHLEMGQEALEEGKWAEAQRNFSMVQLHGKEEPLKSDSLYYLGICAYHLKDYESANKLFDEYLNGAELAQYVKDVLNYKFEIAEAFREGAKRRLFSMKQLPKWATGHQLALEIYEEIILAQPYTDLGAKAMFSKGLILREKKDYLESTESFKKLSKNFPDHDLSLESYYEISRNFLYEMLSSSKNEELIILAKLNIARLRQQFPNASRLEVDQNYERMVDLYATSLLETAKFYDKKKQVEAATIYYGKIVRDFAGSTAAEAAQSQLDYLKVKGQ